MHFKLQKILFFILFISSQSIWAQNSIPGIIKQINFQQDTIKAIFKYVATTVSYDTQFKDAPPEYHSYDEVLADVLDDNKGVCMHYAALFHALCEKLGYKSYIISGYTKFMNQPAARVPHAWNAVLVDGEWRLFDPTWASGYVVGNIFYPQYEEVWFNRHPEEFIYSHIPFDPIWQFRKNPATHQQIAAGIYKGPELNFSIGIDGFNKSSEIEKLEQSLERIKKAGVSNQLIKNKVAYLEGQIEIHQHNQQVYTFHYGIKLLHKARSEYFNYLSAKKKKFKKYSEQEISETLYSFADKAMKAYQHLKVISVKNHRLQKSVDENLYQTQQLLEYAEDEEEFLNKYLRKWKPFRVFAF